MIEFILTGFASSVKFVYEATGEKLDVGKSCVRFRKLEDLPLEVIGKAVARTSVEDFITLYERSRKGRR